MHGVAPLGSTGEFMYLTASQRTEVVTATIRAAAGRVPVVAGVSAFSTHDALEQAQRAEQLGCDGLVVMRQHGFATPEAGVVDYFASIAQAVSCPIVIYTNPGLLGTDLSIESLAELSTIDTIRYVKDATPCRSRGHLSPISSAYVTITFFTREPRQRPLEARGRDALRVVARMRVCLLGEQVREAEDGGYCSSGEHGNPLGRGCEDRQQSSVQKATFATIGRLCYWPLPYAARSRGGALDDRPSSLVFRGPRDVAQ